MKSKYNATETALIEAIGILRGIKATLELRAAKTIALQAHDENIYATLHRVIPRLEPVMDEFVRTKAAEKP